MEEEASFLSGIRPRDQNAGKEGAILSAAPNDVFCSVPGRLSLLRFQLDHLILFLKTVTCLQLVENGDLYKTVNCLFCMEIHTASLLDIRLYWSVKFCFFGNPGKITQE
jgi:hypothetical protein